MEESQNNLYRKLNDPTYEPQIFKDVPVHTLGKIAREKFNSTASLYISPQQSLLAPDMSEILKCLSVCLYWKMKENENVVDRVVIDIFLEEKYPLGKKVSMDLSTPVIDTINTFLKSIYDTEDLSAECAVMVLIFIERLSSLTNITLDGTNWKRVCFGAIIVASKVWEDTAVWNSDFRSVFPLLKLGDLAKLEREFLKLLDFNVAIKSSVYAQYYFSLRTLAERNEINFPLQPLTKVQEERLEDSSSGMEHTVKQFNIQRSHSAEGFIMSSVHLGIEDMMLDKKF